MSVSKFDLDTTIAASTDQVSRKLGDESVVLSLSQSSYFGMDEVGTRIWQLVQEPELSHPLL